jgi:hypothetical protein
MRDASSPGAATAGFDDGSEPPSRQGFWCSCCGQFSVTAVEGVFRNPSVGSPQRFCTPRCRQAAYRRRKAGVAENIALQHDGGRGRRLRPASDAAAPKVSEE